MTNLLTVVQAAEYLQISTRQVWKLIGTEGLPTVVLCGSDRKKTRRIDPAKLQEWIENRNKVKGE